MSVSYQAQNIIQFLYSYIDESNVPIDISSATSVTLYLFLPSTPSSPLFGATKTLTGSVSAAAPHNLAMANTTVSTITNADLSTNIVTISWQFLVVLASGELIWSPLQSIAIDKNLG